MSQGNTVKNKQLAQYKERVFRSNSPSLPVPAHNTRARGKATANATITDAGTADVTTQEVDHASFEEAKSHLMVNGLLPEGVGELVDGQALAKVLITLAASTATKLPSNTQKSILSLSHIALKLADHCVGCKHATDLPDLITDSSHALQMELIEVNERLEILEKVIQDKLPERVDLSGITDSGTSGAFKETTKSLNQAATHLEGMIAKAADSTTELANTARSYKEVLLGNPTNMPTRGTTVGLSQQTEGAAAELLHSAMERKDRQVLITIDENQIATQSNESLLEKVEQAINDISKPPPPANITVALVSKIRKNAIIINFFTKDAATWLKRPEVSKKFAASFIAGAEIKPRQYPLLMPRIPITFDPGNPEHLREVEEANLLDKFSIAKARWIKPPYRRSPGQKAAHASFLFNDVTAANTCIKDGMIIFNSKAYPSRLKQEPTQCMKCRGWGHYANDCNAQKNTCGTCGGEHRSHECNEPEKRYCTSCKTSAHASWDRNCPEFVKRCNWFDEKNPDNTLKFFPTEETWTQEVRPAKFPFTECFPPQYAVNNATPPTRNGGGLTIREHVKKTKHPKNKGKKPEGQTTLDGYAFTRCQSQTRAASEDSEMEEGEVSQFIQSDHADSISASTSTC